MLVQRQLDEPTRATHSSISAQRGRPVDWSGRRYRSPVRRGAGTRRSALVLHRPAQLRRHPHTASASRSCDGPARGTATGDGDSPSRRMRDHRERIGDRYALVRSQRLWPVMRWQQFSQQCGSIVAKDHVGVEVGWVDLSDELHGSVRTAVTRRASRRRLARRRRSW